MRAGRIFVLSSCLHTSSPLPFQEIGLEYREILSLGQSGLSYRLMSFQISPQRSSALCRIPTSHTVPARQAALLQLTSAEGITPTKLLSACSQMKALPIFPDPHLDPAQPSGAMQDTEDRHSY